MIFNHLKNFFRGWIIGDFVPSLIQTDKFEIGILTHKKDEYWAPHYHKIATEYNVVLNGIVEINEQIFEKNDIFIIYPNEISIPKFLTDVEILVIKVPSIPNDKYLVE